MAEERRTISSVNPATLETIGTLDSMTKEEVDAAIKKAKGATDLWASLSFEERGAYLMDARQYIVDNIDQIAETISRENGKPKTESLSADILPVTDLISYWVENAERHLRPKRIRLGIMDLMLRRSYLTYEPMGVIGIVSPWNFPFSIPMGEVIMSLITGNCVLLKPSSSTAYIGLEMGKVFEDANLPDGVFTLITGDSKAGDALVRGEIDKIVFTGSVPIGKVVMKAASERLTPCVLELGGKDPMIVCEDAHIKNAARAAVWGAFSNSGQCCASIERCYVHESVADDFITQVVEITNKLRQGPGLDWDTDVGAMTTESQLKIVEEQVEEARSRGAKILTGGERNATLPGLFYKPTVLTNLDHSFECIKEETFGPLLPIITFSDEEDAIALANDSNFGLTACVWTKDIGRGRRLAAQIKSGTVMINECIYTHALSQTPWGGVKESGFGRTHSFLGLTQLVQAKHIHINRLSWLSDFWWYGYGEKLYKHLKRLTNTLTGPRLIDKIKAIPTFIKAMLMRKY